MSRFDRSFGLRRIVVAGLAACLLTAAVPAPAHADTESELAAARTQLEAIGTEADQISNDLVAMTDELELTRDEIVNKEREIADRQGMLSTYVSSEYKYGFADLLQMVLSSKSFDDLVSRVTYINKVSDAQAQTITEVKVLKDELSATQAQQEENVTALEQKIDELNAQRAAAAELVNSLDAQLQEELRAEAEANAALQRALEESQNSEAPGGSDDTSNDSSSDQTPTTPDNSGDSNNGNTDNGNTDNGGSNSGGGSSDVTPPSSSNGDAIAARAMAQIGASYVWGACRPGAFDCSGLVSYAVTGQYVHYWSSGDIASWPSVSDPQPGDILYRPGHVGVYVGNGMMVHASTPSTGVRMDSVPSNMRYVRYPG